MVARQLLNASRTTTLNILLSLHMLLLAAILFGTLTSAVVPKRSQSAGIHAAAVIPTSNPILINNPKATAAPVSPFTHGHRTHRQVQGFECPPAVNDCKGPKDCLYPNPTHCNWFIQCDASGIAYTEACPLESMVWNVEKKECDHSYACKKAHSGRMIMGGFE